MGVFKSKNQAIVKTPFTNKAALFSVPHCCLVAWFFVAEAVFQVMVAKNIVLEINYSGLRKATQQFMPHFEVLE